MDDLIRRRSAIELIRSLYPSEPILRMNREQWKKKYKQYIDAEKALEMLPPVQPEPTLEQIEEYCHKRGLSIVDNALLHKYAQAETAKRIIGKSRDGITMWYQCDMCNEPVDEKDTFCSGCGRRFVNG